MNSSNRDTNFSNQRTAIPFGKFDSGSDDVFPCNESMVGRDGARAKLIDFLTNAGTRKAILITGRRGMGKTSFVNYCLGEYKEARIERYWRSDIGRTIGTWIWLLIASIVFAATFVIAKQALDILLTDVLKTRNYLLGILLIPLIIYIGYPLLYAIKITTKLPNRNAHRLTSIFWFTLVLFGTLFILYIPDSISPTITFSWFLVILTMMYFIGEWPSFFSKKAKTLDTLLHRVIIFIVSLALLYLICVFQLLNDPIFKYANSTSIDKLSLNNIVVASIFLGLSLLLQSVHLHKNPQHIRNLQIGQSQRITKYKLVLYGISFLSFPILFYFLTGNSLNLSSNWVYLLSGSIMATIIATTSFQQKKENDSKYRKCYIYPSVLLALKAIFLILLSLYALQPIIAILTTLTGITPSPSPSQTEKITHIGLIVAIATLIFWIEYEWIIRPGQIRRRDQSMGGSNRPGYYNDIGLEGNELPKKINLGGDNTDDGARKAVRNEVQKYMQREANIRERRRTLEALTFIGHFKHLHISTLVSTINLGFEELDHRSVIHAMLLDIREQYHAKFVSLHSPRVIARSIFFIVLAMLLVHQPV